MSVFYELIPVDTLFFRGNIPMEAGMLASESLFPPPPSVFIGAIRTYLGKENGKWGEEKADFEIKAIMLKKDDVIYYPAPYSWFEDGIKAEILQENEGILCSSENIPFAKTEEAKDVKSLGGKWISAIDSKICKSKEFFYENEKRTGIALDYSKHSVKEGQLYSANHVRLQEGVSIVIYIEGSLQSLENATLFLGGEKRVVKCKLMDKFSISIPDNIALVPIMATQERLNEVFATGRIIYISGWDLDKKYHKPSQGYFPAGTVFNKPIKEIL
ncbi:MAG: hypothetical protein FWC26_12595 [Fibromonadales bacterium]|nr:hypothetical protein [Fibromonadales bacterium]